MQGIRAEYQQLKDRIRSTRVCVCVWGAAWLAGIVVCRVVEAEVADTQRRIEESRGLEVQLKNNLVAALNAPAVCQMPPPLLPREFRKFAEQPIK
jgi:hypothetical protein